MVQMVTELKANLVTYHWDPVGTCDLVPRAWNLLHTIFVPSSWWEKTPHPDFWVSLPLLVDIWGIRAL